MKLTATALMIAVCQPAAWALPNGLGRLPGLGWNSDYCTNCTGPVSRVTMGPEPQVPLSYRQGGGCNGFGGENFVKHIADHMHTVKYGTTNPKTLQELGFHYVNMDASWDTFNRSSSGDLVPDPALWPSGLDHTVSYLHSLGLGFGLYGDRGTLDCAKHPGAFGHESQDGAFMGKHKIDWYKEDACYASGDQATALNLYEQMRDALNETGYSTWFALCGWEPWYAPHGQQLANSARIGPDTGTGWTSVMKNVENALPVQQYIGGNGAGGYWNDGSLQLTPGMGCHDASNCMSNGRFQSMYALWTILSFNILLVGDFAKLNPLVMGTWTNQLAVSINQDSLGKGAVRIDSSNQRPVLVHTPDPHAQYAPMKVQECGGEPQDQQWVFSKAGLLPGTVSNQGKTCLNVEGCGKNLIYDSCPSSCGSSCSPKSTPCGNQRFVLTDAGKLQAELPGELCATAGKDGVVTLSSCVEGTATQIWKYENATQQLTTGTGLCVTASGSGPGPVGPTTTLVLGRALTGNSFAVLFLNNEPTAAAMTCDVACMQRLGATDSGTSYEVTEVWSGALVSTVSGGVALVTKGMVPANGGSVYYKLSPK